MLLRSLLLATSLLLACSPEPTAASPAAAKKTNEADPSEVDMSRACVTGQMGDEIMCAPKDDCAVVAGKCYHRKAVTCPETVPDGGACPKGCQLVGAACLKQKGIIAPH